MQIRSRHIGKQKHPGLPALLLLAFRGEVSLWHMANTLSSFCDDDDFRVVDIVGRLRLLNYIQLPKFFLCGYPWERTKVLISKSITETSNEPESLLLYAVSQQIFLSSERHNELVLNDLSFTKLGCVKEIFITRKDNKSNSYNRPTDLLHQEIIDRTVTIDQWIVISETAGLGLLIGSIQQINNPRGTYL